MIIKEDDVFISLQRSDFHAAFGERYANEIVNASNRLECEKNWPTTVQNCPFYEYAMICK